MIEVLVYLLHAPFILFIGFIAVLMLAASFFKI